MRRNGNREPEEVHEKQNWKINKCYRRKKNSQRWKEKERSPSGKKEKLQATTFTVYEVNRWSEEPNNLELAEDKTVEEGNSGILITAQDQVLRAMNIQSTIDQQSVSPPMWIVGRKTGHNQQFACWMKNAHSATYGIMTELVRLFLGQYTKGMDFQLE